MSQQSNNCAIAVIGIDIGKNSFHVVGHDQRGAIVLRQKWSRGQIFQLGSVAKTRRCVIVHEAARTGGFGAEIAALTYRGTRPILAAGACDPRYRLRYGRPDGPP
jgi:hypothetical protein